MPQEFVGNFEDSQNINFCWNKRLCTNNNFDIKDLMMFFKIKSIRELKEIYPKKYENFTEESKKIKSWIKTFEKVPNKFLTKNNIPDSLAKQYNSALFDLFSSWIKDISAQEVYQSFLNYYEKNKSSFYIQKEMFYDVLTSDGYKKVDLEFSENFRFKSVHGNFNLFNMPKEERVQVIPEKNSIIYMVDYRQFEFRTFLSIVGADIDFSHNNLYEEIGRKLNLKNPKLDLISYLYSNRIDSNISKIIDKEAFLNSLNTQSFIWKDYPVFMKDDFDKNKKIHTVIQTISYMIYLKKFRKVLDLLKQKKSKLIYPLHDAMIFTIQKDELELIEEIPEIVSDDIYKTKEYCGKNLRDIEEI